MVGSVLAIIGWTTAAAEHRVAVHLAPVAGAERCAEGVLAVAVPEASVASGTLAESIIDLPVLPAVVDLPDTIQEGWTVALRSAGCWSAPRSVTPVGTERELEIVVWPTGTVAGSLDLPPEAESTGTLSASFHDTSESTSGHGAQGEVTCVRDGAVFECELPATALDVRLTLPGFAPHYLWEVAIEAARSRDLGRVRMVPGASVAGRVEWSGDPEAVSVTLARDLLGVPPPGLGRRLEMTSSEAGIDARGRFQITGLAAGTYSAIATSEEGGSSLPWDGIVLEEGAEVYLDEPLRIRPPTTVEIVVSPAFDHRLEPWTVTLEREIPGSTYLEPVISAPTEADGSIELTGARPGIHHVYVDDSQGARMHSGAVELLGQRPVRIEVEIAAVVVRGKVIRGGAPYEARLIFANGRGERAEILTDAEGVFSGFLADEGTWMIEVLPASGSSRRLLGTSVEVLRGEDGVAWVPIELPGGSVAGVVEDEEGEPVDRALVTLVREGRLLGQAWSENGRFALDGLTPGAALLRAESESGQQSETMSIEVEEDQQSELTLVVSPSLRLPVAVRYQGLPVAGARIRYSTPDGSVQREITSSPSGRAELVLPPRTGVVDVVALAARLPTRILRLRVNGESPRLGTVRIDLPSAPGTLLVPIERRRQRIVFGGEVELMIWSLLSPSGSAPPAELDPTAGIFTIQIGEGRYALCDAEMSHCTEGNLAPGGVLDLRNGRQERGRSRDRQPGSRSES